MLGHSSLDLNRVGGLCRTLGSGGSEGGGCARSRPMEMSEEAWLQPSCVTEVGWVLGLVLGMKRHGGRRPDKTQWLTGSGWRKGDKDSS